MNDLLAWLNQPVDLSWTLAVMLVAWIIGHAGAAVITVRADQARHDEWMRRFRAGEVR